MTPIQRNTDSEVAAVRETVLRLCESSTEHLMGINAGKLCRDDLVLPLEQGANVDGHDADRIVWACALYWTKIEKTPTVCLIAHDLMMFYDIAFSRALLCLSMKVVILWCYFHRRDCELSTTHLAQDGDDMMQHHLKVVNNIIIGQSSDMVNEDKQQEQEAAEMFRRAYPELNPCHLPSLKSSLGGAKVGCENIPLYVYNVFGISVSKGNCCYNDFHRRPT